MQYRCRGHKENKTLMKSTAILLVFTLFIISGCEEQIPQPLKPLIKPQQGKEAKQPAATTVSVEKMEEAGDTYSYRIEGRRDPFKSLLLGLKEKKTAGITPLQQRSLVELRVIGIVWGAQGYMAMIETPDGKGYLIKEGTLIGPDGGSVKKITEDSVIIEEVYTDYYGRKRSKQTVLRLHIKEEGGG